MIRRKRLDLSGERQLYVSTLESLFERDPHIRRGLLGLEQVEVKLHIPLRTLRGPIQHCEPCLKHAGPHKSCRRFAESLLSEDHRISPTISVDVTPLDDGGMVGQKTKPYIGFPEATDKCLGRNPLPSTKRVCSGRMPCKALLCSGRSKFGRSFSVHGTAAMNSTSGK
jgi:hypothetical protein